MNEWTKGNALKRLICAGYNAEITETGLDVRGDGWEVHYDDRGEDFTFYAGNVPSDVEDLSCWDDPTTRAAE